VLTRQDLVRALGEAGPNVTVRRVMRSDCPIVPDNEQLERSFERLRQEGYSTLPVVHEGHLVGLITLDNILEWMMVHSALSNRFGLLAREGVGGQAPFNP
jgi:predicted transcriptional regulator